MRDIALTLFVIWGLIKTLQHPHIGIYLWTWVSLMNPHRLTYGFAHALPFAMVIAITTLFSLTINKTDKLNLSSPIALTLILYFTWVCITTIFALHPDLATHDLNRFSKIVLFTLLITIFISDKNKLDIMIWVIALSIGFYGIKGGIFTVLTGGSHRVWGPEDSFVFGNNEIALALLMTIPLFRYLQTQTQNRKISRFLTISMLLCSASVLGSQSRGALIGIAAIGVFYILKSNKKFSALLVVALISALAIFFMPQSWHDRMNTIETYKEDGSAMSRFNSWAVAYNVANDRITGGGASMFTRETFSVYAPDPNTVFDAHSIYFGVIGEHGWIGFILFMLLASQTWATCSKVAKSVTSKDDAWMTELARMIQVCLIGYYSAGAFLGLHYYDGYFNLIAVTVVLRKLHQKSLEKNMVPPTRGGDMLNPK